MYSFCLYVCLSVCVSVCVSICVSVCVSYCVSYCVLTETIKETRVICGGGCTEMLMANAIDKQVPQTAGKAALAMEAFSRALRQVIDTDLPWSWPIYDPCI